MAEDVLQTNDVAALSPLKARPGRRSGRRLAAVYHRVRAPGVGEYYADAP